MGSEMLVICLNVDTEISHGLNTNLYKLYLKDDPKIATHVDFSIPALSSGHNIGTGRIVRPVPESCLWVAWIIMYVQNPYPLQGVARVDLRHRKHCDRC